MSSESGVALAVGDQRLDADVRGAGPDRPHGGGHVAGCTVGEIVAGHHGDHREAQPHLLDRLGHPGRLVGIERFGLAGVDQAEAALPGAPLARDHERGGAVGPALEDVGAPGLLAHRDQVEVAHGPLQPHVVVGDLGTAP